MLDTRALVNPIRSIYVSKNTLDGELNVRISSSTLDVFKQKTSHIGVPYQVMLRNIIEAFNNGNLRIIADENTKNTIGGLYDVDR